MIFLFSPNTFIHSFIHLMYMKPTDNHDVENKKNIISVVGRMAIAGQISLLSNAIKLHKNKMQCKLLIIVTIIRKVKASMDSVIV